MSKVAKLAFSSMTGHGDAILRAGGLAARVDVRSYNGRGLDIHVKGESLSGKEEFMLRAAIARVCARGRVEMYASLDGGRPALRSKLLFRAAVQALGKLQRHRLREGMALRRELHAHLRGYRGCFKVLARAAKELTARQSVPTAHEHASKGVKGDTAEEVARIEVLLTEIDATLNRPLAGKLLEFLLQELLRETTALGSKIHGATRVRQVVFAKVFVDRLREQVANIE